MSKKEHDLAKANTIKLRASKNYLGKPDFFSHDGKAIELDVEIVKVSGVVQDWHGKDADPDIVLTFKDQRKRLIVNKTNQIEIANQHGDGKVHEVWVGKTIRLFWTLEEPRGPKKGRKIRNPSDPDTPGGVRVKAAR